MVQQPASRTASHLLHKRPQISLSNLACTLPAGLGAIPSSAAACARRCVTIVAAQKCPQVSLKRSGACPASRSTSCSGCGPGCVQQPVHGDVSPLLLPR